MTFDTTTASVGRLTVLGKERGYVTVDEFFAALDPEQVSSEMIEETMVMLSYIGIHVVMDDDPDDDAPSGPRSPLAPAVRRASAFAWLRWPLRRRERADTVAEQVRPRPRRDGGARGV